MKLLQSLNINTIYWLMALLLLMETLQALLKYFSPYYFGSFSLGAFSVLMLLLGTKLKISGWLVVPLALLGLTISVLKYFIIWN